MPPAPQITLRGRDAELGELGSAVDRARSGRLAIVLVEGEAGIGKTRLLAETLRTAQRQGCEVAAAKADEMEQTRPFGVIADALGCVRSASDPQRADIAALLATHAHSDHGPITISTDPGLRFRTVDALCDLVESLALRRPLVISLDDLQWADPSSLLTLAALARSAAGLAVALIGCYRPFPQPVLLRQSLDSVDAAGAVHVRLDQLAEHDVYDLVTEVLGAEPGAGLQTVVAGAAGNPLFVIELVNSILNEGTLQTGDGHAEVIAAKLPPSVRLTILRRLSSLPESTLQTLRAGSLLGSTFSLRELAAVTARPVGELVPALEAAMTAGVLDEDGIRLRFRHDLIRDAIYADMTPSLRLGLHREAAVRLTEIGSPATRVADQFIRGATPGDPEAIDWLTKAAREAVATSPETAADFLERAAELMTKTDPRRDMLLVERADSLMLAGRVAEAVVACQSLLDHDHRPIADAPARVRLGAALLVNGRPAEALHELDAVAQSAASADTERIRSLGEASTARLWLGDFDGAAKTAEQAHLAALRAGDHVTATSTLATQAVVACMRGQVARAIELSGEAVALADDSPDRIGHEYPVYAPYGWILMELDQAEQARTALDTGRRLCEEIGVRWPLATYQAYLAVERFHAGEWDDAVAELEAGIGFAEETGVTYALKPSHSAQAIIRLHRNDLPGAWQSVDNAAAVADRGSRLFDYRALLARALLLEAEGDTPAAFTTLADRWRICQDAGMAIDYPVVGPDLVRLARAVGDADLAEEVASAVNDVASANRVPSITGAALRCRGLLTDDAEAMAGALDAYSKSPRRLELALTCEEAAGLIARQGDTAGARSLLERANGIFEHLDATRDLVRVDAALRQLGIRRGRRGPRQRPQWGWGSLTPTERTVADLVAEGLTNPQIAERLYVSRRTVQTHVSHTFTKLGMASRAQLAAAVAAQTHEAQ
ncbi:MAG TPA: AAA family ATPase [Jatrophihabitans sp.]|nr:AAA family ATPase [Jatrophihabitans sp.]